MLDMQTQMQENKRIDKHQQVILSKEITCTAFLLHILKIFLQKVCIDFNNKKAREMMLFSQNIICPLSNIQFIFPKFQQFPKLKAVILLSELDTNTHTCTKMLTVFRQSNPDYFIFSYDFSTFSGLFAEIIILLLKYGKAK